MKKIRSNVIKLGLLRSWKKITLLQYIKELEKYVKLFERYNLNVADVSQNKLKPIVFQDYNQALRVLIDQNLTKYLNRNKPVTNKELERLMDLNLKYKL